MTVEIKEDPRIEAFLRASSYFDCQVTGTMRILDDDSYIMIHRLLFHCTMLRGDLDDTVGYWDRWCYSDEAGARSALAEFPCDPPVGYEPKGWHRHPASTRRRPDGDATLEFNAS